VDAHTVAAELLRVPPNEFVAARNARVAELKAAGDRELAGAVAKLRRQSAAEWALNVIAHEHPDLVGEWAAAAAAARAAQESPSANLRQALADWRAATTQVVRAAPRGAPKGELTAELTQIGGVAESTARFVAGLLGAGGEPPAVPETPRGKPRRAAAESPSADRKAAQRRAKERERALKAAQREVAEAEADAEAAELEASAADAAYDEAVETVEAARAALAAAETECDRAKRRATAARKVHEEARSDVDRARQALADVRDE
jgi:hypothetical protein